MKPLVQGMVDIGAIVFNFARVKRVTLADDGKTLESDTDHTVMLSIAACALAEQMYPDLDRGMIAQYAIVHDLVEAYAGDTDTFGITDEGRKAKEEREHQAYLRIKREFEHVFPWIPETISAYESLDTKEARFVKTVDKCMSKITHILNAGVYFKERDMSAETIRHDYRLMADRARISYGKEFPELLTLMDDMIDQAIESTYGNI